jgi:hypothetical protein
MACRPEKRSIASTIMLAGALCALTACTPLALTSYGVGASTAVSHTLGGITYRTFTASSQQVKKASLDALNQMGIKVAGTEKGSSGDVLRATATDREIEITLEPISPNTTRMRVVARNGGIFYDSATATEIIMQTERKLVKT